MYRLRTALLFALFSLSAATAYADEVSIGADLYAEKDYSAAAAVFKKAADKGNADAQFNLGLMYLNGEGVEQDYRQARIWFEQSAAKGNVRAEVNLGRLYAKAKGVAPNYGMAATWYRKAADQGYADGQYSLGVLYLNGISVPRDYARARELFQQAADQNNASAQYQLGLMYFKGKGMTVNLVEAYKWLILADDYEETALYRQYAESKMNRDQIAEAKQLAAEWQPLSPARP